MGSGIDQVLEEAVASGAIPNVAAIAANKDGVIYEGAAGPRVVGEPEKITPGTHFRIMSMTKMVCTVAALQQVEKGKLDLEAPIEKYCPSFAEIQVLTGFDGDTPKLRAPEGKATVKQLVTHTTGLAYWFWNESVVHWEKVTGVPNVVAGSNASFKAPMVGDPGSAYVYGINTDWLGRVVEAVTGVGLDVAIRDGITGPLGMNQTAFLMNDAQRAGSTPVHVQGADGKWTSIGEVLNQKPDWWAGGHGLYSTPRDYIRFERMLLRGGELDGVRILQEATVRSAFRNQIGDLDFPSVLPTADPASTDTFTAGPGNKWGLGLLLNTEDRPGMRRAGSGAWAGLCNTHFWVDPTTGICASIYSNTLPFVPPAAVKLYNDFEKALYASL
jgi:CubicO group peptidase (beta-lactamase class C family)